MAAGYGHVVIQALEAGAGKVFANEIDARQLAIVESRTPARYAERLVCCLGEFPEQLDFPPHRSTESTTPDCFTFFDGGRIRAGLVKFHQWLKSGGRLFLVNDSVYRTIFKPLIPVYEQRVAAGEDWPGFIEDVAACIPAFVQPDAFPETMNFLDPVVLARELTRAGLKVVTAGFYPYTGSFAPGRLDGRELSAVIRVKD